MTILQATDWRTRISAGGSQQIIKLKRSQWEVKRIEYFFSKNLVLLKRTYLTFK